MRHSFCVFHDALLLKEMAVAIKDDAKPWTIKEQIIEDRASGLTFQFEVMPNGEPRFRVLGNLPFGNREFVFNKDGEKSGSGTATRGTCRPAWMTKVDG